MTGLFLFLRRAVIDRAIVYASQIPLDTDVLNTNKNSMIGVGLALLDILGSTPAVGGALCTPTAPASLAVAVGPGRIYSLQNVDNTAYGSIAADITDQILKQGIKFGSLNLATPAPATAGQSINYLIEAAYQDSDTNSVVLNFFNTASTPANPLPPFSGQNNNGAPLPTVRSGVMVVQAKPGIPAATGSQATPAPDAGFVGLYVVTVANGQATVTSSNIAQLPSAPFLSANLGSPLVSHLGADLAITNSTVLANTGLGVNIPLPGTYAFEILLNFNGTATGAQGVKIGRAGTAPLAALPPAPFGIGPMLGSVNGVAQNTSFFNGTISFANISVATGVDFLLLKFSATFSAGGTFVLQAAQNTASANATNILAPSYMTATKV